jgi:hypothetical protein
VLDPLSSTEYSVRPPFSIPTPPCFPISIATCVLDPCISHLFFFLLLTLPIVLVIRICVLRRSTEVQASVRQETRERAPCQLTAPWSCNLFARFVWRGPSGVGGVRDGSPGDACLPDRIAGGPEHAGSPGDGCDRVPELPEPHSVLHISVIFPLFTVPPPSKRVEVDRTDRHQKPSPRPVIRYRGMKLVWHGPGSPV